MTDSRDEIGERMKAYEAGETARVFDPAVPIYARIDGRAFSSFTRDLQRPFDPRLTAAMIATTRHLIKETDARIGYTQSDEISLVWLYAAGTEPLFGGKLHKWTSVLASLAAAVFQQELRQQFGPLAAELCARLPHFDARVLQLPTTVEAANVVLWRTLDARKNAVSMAARSVFQPADLQGKDQSQMRAMLVSKGIDFDAYPRAFKWGTFLRRQTIERTLTIEECERISLPHRPLVGTLVARSIVAEIEMPEFVTLSNRVAVIFDGAEPIPRTAP